METIKGDLGFVDYRAMVSSETYKPVDRPVEHGLGSIAVRFRHYRESSISRLAGVRTLNVGHDTPRDHHSTRHGNRRG